jgi:hypothetical protein
MHRAGRPPRVRPGCYLGGRRDLAGGPHPDHPGGAAAVRRQPMRHRRGGLGGDRQHLGDRAAAGAPGGSGGGLQPAEDQGDRRGQGQDRQGRRGGVGGAAGGRLPALGVAARRPNACATPSGHPPRPYRAAADPAAGTRCSRSCTATSSVAARPRICSAPRAGPGWPPRTYQQTSTRRSGRCCASSTSTARSFGSSTPNSAGSAWSASRSADS